MLLSFDSQESCCNRTHSSVSPAPRHSTTPPQQTEEKSGRNLCGFGSIAVTMMAQTKLEGNQICPPNQFVLLIIPLETPAKKKRMGRADSEALRTNFFRVGRIVTNMLVTVSQESSSSYHCWCHQVSKQSGTAPPPSSIPHQKWQWGDDKDGALTPSARGQQSGISGDAQLRLRQTGGPCQDALQSVACCQSVIFHRRYTIPGNLAENE